MTITAREANRELWRRGSLGHLLHATQREMLAEYEASSARRYVICCSRRLGKSYLGCVRGIVQCIRNPGYQYRYAAPTQLMARQIAYPHMRKILDTCPTDLRPVENRGAMTWRWRNGSEFRLAGCDGPNMDRLRGGEMHEGFVDEAGFVAGLGDLIEDVLMPMTLTTDGRILLASTPPVSPAHDFVRYYSTARAVGAATHRTIYDAPHITRERAQEYVDEATRNKGESTARREYLAEVVVDESMAVVPEFAANRSAIVVELEVPRWAKRYVIADFGFNDLTFVVFGLYDFANARPYIVDEVVLQRASGWDVAIAVKAKETELGWTDAHRYADAPLQMLASLGDARNGPGMSFAPAPKTDSEAALNTLRMDCHQRRLAIHPRCTRLIQHMEFGVWASRSRGTFARPDDESFGHFDGIDAAKYFCRVVDRRHNPAPAYAPEQLANPDFFTADVQRKSAKLSDIERAFRGRRSS